MKFVEVFWAVNPFRVSVKFFLEVRREEARRCVILHPRDANSVAQPESLALFSRGADTDENRKNSKHPWCDHCKWPWQTCETCWKLHGKPLNWKKKGDSRVLQASANDPRSQSSSEKLLFMKEQIDILCQLLQSSNSSINPSPLCSFAQKGYDLGEDDWQCLETRRSLFF